MNAIIMNRLDPANKSTRVSRLTLFGVALFCAAASSARANTIAVTNSSDSGAGTLRQALSSASNGDTIVFSVSMPATIALTNGELIITDNLVISGPGATNLAISGNSSSRVCNIATNR